jgi:hypothetical protein
MKIFSSEGQSPWPCGAPVRRLKQKLRPVAGFAKDKWLPEGYAERLRFTTDCGNSYNFPFPPQNLLKPQPSTIENKRPLLHASVYGNLLRLRYEMTLRRARVECEGEKKSQCGNEKPEG